MPASTDRPQPFAQGPAWQATAQDPAVASVERSGRHAMIWSLVGFLTCCSPLSIVGLVLGLRARSLARERKLTAPATSTVAIAFSAVALLMVGTFAVWFAFDQAALSSRIAELSARIPEHDTEEQLGQQTACELAELRIRTDGWGGDDPIVIDGFDCPSRVVQRDDEAELPEFSFKTSSHDRVTVAVCYKRGVRWTVKSFREAGGCFEQ